MKTIPNSLATALVLFGLSACGGGGGGGTHNSTITAPADLTYSSTDVLQLSSVALTPLAATVTGTVTSFEVSPTLPTGLALNTTTGTLSGTPTAPALRKTYTITARNTGGSTSADVRIEIAAPQRFAFVTSPTDDSFASLTVDTQAARFLRGPLGFAGNSDTGAERPVAHPSGRFFYVPHAGTNTLVAWGIDQENGALDRFAVRALGAGPHAAAMHPSGSWLVVANMAADTVRVFAVDPTTGIPTQTLVFPVGTMPSDIAFSPDGRQLFVTHAGVVLNGLGSSLASYAFSASTGSLSQQGSPLALNGGRPKALVVDPHEPLVYVTLSQFDAVVVVRTSPSGTLTAIAPLHAAGAQPVDVEIDATGRNLFVAAAGEDSIHSFRVTPTTGALTHVGTFPAGDEPVALLREPTGARLFAVARGSSELLTYTVDLNGALATESSLAMRPGSHALTCATGSAPLAWTPRFLHCANKGSDDIHAFTVNAATGALTFAGQTFTDDQPTCLAVGPRTRVAVVVAEGSHTVQSFTVSPTNGVLTPTGASVAITGTPTHVAIDPSGRFAYVVARDGVTVGDGWLMTLAIAPTTGVLTLVDTRASGVASRAVAIEPTGEFVYVANAGDGTAGTANIKTFAIDPVTGVPTSVGSTVPAPGIIGIAFHPDGRTAYAVLRGADSLARYSIDRTSGSLTVVPQVAGPGLEPAALALDPRGGFAWASYTGNVSSGEVVAFPVLAGGELGQPLQQVVDGQEPVALSLDASGRFLYAANQTSNDLSVISVEATTGLMTVQAPAMAGTAPTGLVASATTH